MRVVCRPEAGLNCLCMTTHGHMCLITVQAAVETAVYIKSGGLRKANACRQQQHIRHLIVQRACTASILVERENPAFIAQSPQSALLVLSGSLSGSSTSKKIKKSYIIYLCDLMQGAQKAFGACMFGISRKDAIQGEPVQNAVSLCFGDINAEDHQNLCAMTVDIVNVRCGSSPGVLKLIILFIKNVIAELCSLAYGNCCTHQNSYIGILRPFKQTHSNLQYVQTLCLSCICRKKISLLFCALYKHEQMKTLYYLQRIRKQTNDGCSLLHSY